MTTSTKQASYEMSRRNTLAAPDQTGNAQAKFGPVARPCAKVSVCIFALRLLQETLLHCAKNDFPWVG